MLSRSVETGQRRLTWGVYAVAAAVTAWILVRTWHGPRITGDALWYLSAAENLADGRGLLRFSHYWQSHYPPGYPLALAGFEVLGIPAREASRWLNAALYGGTVLIAGLWLRTFCRSWLPVVAAVSAMASSLSWHYVSSSYNSEPLYMALIVGSLVALSEFLRDPPPQRFWLLFAAAGLAGASAATRWIGFVAILSGSLLLLLAHRKSRALRARLWLAGIHGIAASLPLAVIVSLNKAKTGSWTGDRSELDSYNSLLSAIGLFVQAHASREFVFPWIVLATALLLGLAVRAEDGLRWPRPERTAPFAAFLVVYSIGLLVADQTTEIAVSPRYVLPVFVAFLLVGCELLDQSLSSARRAGMAARLKASRILVVSSAVVVLVIASLSISNVTTTRHVLGTGLQDGAFSGTDSAIRDSDIWDHLELHPIDGMVFSNRPEAIYWFTGHQPVRPVIRAHGEQCADWFREVMPEHIVWFADLGHSDPFRCNVPAVEDQLHQLSVVHRSEDGAVYRADWSQ